MTDTLTKSEETTAPPLIDTVRRWWSELRQAPGTGREDRAALAELRRARDLSDVVMIPAFQVLWHRADRPTGRKAERLALTAAVVAHVRTDTGGASFARQLGPRDARDVGTATLSPLRLRRLLAIDDGQTEALRTALIRLVKHTDGVASVKDLTRATLYWNEKTRIAWAFAYWNGPEPVDERHNEEPTGEAG